MHKVHRYFHLGKMNDFEQGLPLDIVRYSLYTLFVWITCRLAMRVALKQIQSEEICFYDIQSASRR